eukprot:Gb_06605 [translate_table: standard]
MKEKVLSKEQEEIDEAIGYWMKKAKGVDSTQMKRKRIASQNSAPAKRKGINDQEYSIQGGRDAAGYNGDGDDDPPNKKKKIENPHEEEIKEIEDRYNVLVTNGVIVEASSPKEIGAVVMFFRFVTSGEIRRRAEFFEPFILGVSNVTVEQFCKASVEPMGEESDHVHIIALSDALGVPIRVVYLDRSSCDVGKTEVNHHDFIPSNCLTTDAVTVKPFVVLLYRPGHYDILYPK